MTDREIRVTRAEVAAWDGFAAALAGASAALAGLVFVAVSINIRRILSVPRLPSRAGETVILFLGALCECALVLIPHQPVMALGIELVIAGMLALAVLGALVLPALAARTRQPLSWQVTRVIAGLTATAPVILAGCSLIGWIPGGLYWLAAGVLCAVIAASANAWVLLVEVVRDERYRPLAEPSGPAERPSRRPTTLAPINRDRGVRPSFARAAGMGGTAVVVRLAAPALERVISARLSVVAGSLTCVWVS